MHKGNHRSTNMHGRNRYARLCAVLLSLILFCTLTAGCAGTSTGAQSASAPEPAVTEPAVSENSQDPAETAGAVAETETAAAKEETEAGKPSAEAAEGDTAAGSPAAERAAQDAAAAGTETAAAAEESTAQEAAAAEESTAQEAAAAEEGTTQEAAAAGTEEAAADAAAEGATEAAADAAAEGATEAAADAAAEGATEAAAVPSITFDGESDLEYNARQILEADETITKEGALGIAAYLWQMGFGRMSGYPTIVEVNENKVLTVFDEDGLFYNVLLTPEGKIQQIEDVEGNELISLGTKAGERVKPPISGEDVVALLEEWRDHGGHSQVVSAYNQYAHSYGRSKMDSGDQWCSETVSAAYAALGVADRIGGMASNGFTYEKNARAIGAWVSSKSYIPSAGDVLITHDSNGDRHTACVVSCDGSTVKTIAGGGSSIHRSSISVGSGRITGYVVPEW